MKRRDRSSITTQRISPTQVFSALSVALKFIWKTMEPILRDAGNRIVVEEGLPLARDIVAALANSTLSGTEKRDSAVASLKEALVGTKKIAETDIASSMLNWVVETAVNELKALTNQKS